MRIRGKVVVVTGGGGAIGSELARRFASGGAAVVVADRDAESAAKVAESLVTPGRRGAARPVAVDVTDQAAVTRLIHDVNERYGRIDVFCSHAGYSSRAGLFAETPVWEDMWRVKVMSHLYVVQSLIPLMLARGEGHLVLTASAAGLVPGPDAPYTVANFGTVGLARWLAAALSGSGVDVSVLCPGPVRTPRLVAGRLARGNTDRSDLVEPGAVARAVVEAIEAKRFWVLDRPYRAAELGPLPEVANRPLSARWAPTAGERLRGEAR